MKIRFKETIWREVRLDVSPEIEREIMAEMKEMTISDADKLYNFLQEKKLVGSMYENRYDMESSEPVYDGTEPTIEVFLKDGIYKNFTSLY